jgi:hypothetical protein
VAKDELLRTPLYEAVNRVVGKAVPSDLLLASLPHFLTVFVCPDSLGPS